MTMAKLVGWILAAYTAKLSVQVNWSKSRWHLILFWIYLG